MARKPRSKKSEALEIRVSHEEKQAFMSAVSKRGTTASQVIREAMDLFVRNGRIRRRNVMISASILAVSLAAGFVSLSDEAQSETWSGLAEFNEIDTDNDRQVTPDEFAAFYSTAYDNLSGANGAGAFGRAIGALLARYGERVPADFGRTAQETPEQISQACWTALEDSWSTVISNTFASHDADENGWISFPEFSDRQTAGLRRAFRSQDHDDNGVLTYEELNPSSAGIVGRDETSTGDEPVPPPARQTPEHVSICFGAAAEAERELMSPEDGHRAAQALMAGWDLDQNGEVSWAEYRDWSNAMRE